jgi:Leucine-rich repeat (LRR) protein
LQNQAGIRINVDTTLSQDALLDVFEAQMIISGLVFSGDITLHTDSSLVRIGLEDASFNEYLIYEAYPILSGSRQFSVHEAGEESILLNLVTPSRVHIELVAATLYLKEFILSEDEAYERAPKAALELEQNKKKVDRINRHIQSLGRTWVAGETAISRLSYQEKKRMFGGRIPNFQGFEYYKGGIFVLPGVLDQGSAIKSTRTEKQVRYESPYPDKFSWRNRHGADWLTPVRDQTGCKSCYAFGAVAAAELLVNLYFNRHLDYDLSEQQIVSCNGGSCGMGGLPSKAFEFIIHRGIVPEACFPYARTDLDCSGMCSDPTEQIRAANWEFCENTEDFKGAVIAGGAAASISSWSGGHFMQIAGYKVIEPGDSVYVGGYEPENYLPVEIGNPLIGQTAWMCKNSWGEDWGDTLGNYGIGYFVAGPFDLDMYSLQGPMESIRYTDADVFCLDQDGDGYYNWGLGPKPAHCPDSPPQTDGDDSDPCLGPLDEFGNLTSITPPPLATDSIILLGSSANLYVPGNNVRWYTDKRLQNLVHQGELFPTGQTEPGKYTYYTTQTTGACTSTPADISLTIMLEIPRPAGHDTAINKMAEIFLRVEGEAGALFNWYADPTLASLLATGEFFVPPETDTGRYTYYVTQTLCTLESAPDTVELYISDHILFPDSVFLHALIKQGSDSNGDGGISNEEAEALNYLDVSGSKIREMDGIEAFRNLDTLLCMGNQLNRLDLSANHAINYLDCSNNRIISLDFRDNPSLSYLDCSKNRLSSLDISNNTELTRLYCNDNPLKSLDISCNTQLGLFCGSNPYCWSVDISNLPSLREVCVWDSFNPDVIGILGRDQDLQFTNQCGRCSSSVGKNDHEVFELSIFPNPCRDILSIDTGIPDFYHIQITSLNGQVIQTATLEGKNLQMDLSPFPKGVYVLTIHSTDFITTKKIIKL